MPPGHLSIGSLSSTVRDDRTFLKGPSASSGVPIKTWQKYRAFAVMEGFSSSNNGRVSAGTVFSDDLEKQKQEANPPTPLPRVFEPIMAATTGSATLDRQQTAKSSYSLRSQRSYGGQDGYTCHTEDIPAQADAEKHDDPDNEFLVSWDGDSDPMNPRSKSKFQKWVIVILVCMGSLCVYV